jgi:hypothetical protein
VSYLKIRTYDTNPHTADEKLTSVTTIPLPILDIAAKHIPDQIIHIIADRQDPNSGTLSFNPHTLIQMINEILQSVEARRKSGTVQGLLMEIAVKGQDSDTLNDQERTSPVRIVFSVEQAE